MIGPINASTPRLATQDTSATPKAQDATTPQSARLAVVSQKEGQLNGLPSHSSFEPLQSPLKPLMGHGPVVHPDHLSLPKMGPGTLSPRVPSPLLPRLGPGFFPRVPSPLLPKMGPGPVVHPNGPILPRLGHGPVVLNPESPRLPMIGRGPLDLKLAHDPALVDLGNIKGTES